MPITLNGSTGITTPGQSNTANETISGTLSVTGATTLTGATTMTGGIAGDVSSTGTVTMASSFKRNRIINGNMQVWQRGTSFTNVGSGSPPAYTTDRWFGLRGGYAVGESISQQTGFSGFQYCTRIQRANGDTSTQSLQFGQVIENLNMYDLAGLSITVSFYARTASSGYSGGALIVQAITGTGTDQGSSALAGGTWTGSAYAVNSSTSITTTATRYTFTGTCAAGINELGLLFIWTPTGTAGATDYIEITGVQLEVGTVATPYERQIYSDQLAQCQRYLPAFSGNHWFAGATASSSTTGYAIAYFPVQTRVPPTGVVVNSAANFTFGNLVAFNGTCTSFGWNSASTLSALINPTCNAGLSTSLYTTLWGNSSALMYFTGCEL